MDALRTRLTLGLPLLLLLVTVIGVPTMIFGANGLPRHRRLRAQLASQLEENHRLASDLLRLRTELEAFQQDPRARERAVREELGWVRRDEIVVEIPARVGRAL